MKIAILGSGTASPRLDRNMAGYLMDVVARDFMAIKA